MKPSWVHFTFDGLGGAFCVTGAADVDDDVDWIAAAVELCVCGDVNDVSSFTPEMAFSSAESPFWSGRMPSISLSLLMAFAHSGRPELAGWTQTFKSMENTVPGPQTNSYAVGLLDSSFTHR